MSPTQRFASKPLLVSFLSALTVLTTGCAANFNPSPVPGQTSLGNIQGVVHGGSQVIGGSHIYVFAAGTSGYGGAGIAASTTNASVSVMNSVSGGAYPTAYDSTLKAYYVTSDANGNFGITGDYTCTSGTQVYIYALGGNPGTYTNNPVAGLLAVLGQCPSTGTLASLVPFVSINEASTIAAAYSFAGFATDATHVSSSGTTLAQTGIANAFANAANLYAINGSSNGGNSITPNGTFVVPQANINTLANILAACVNSAGASSTGCSTLFTNAKSSGSTGTTATDTATAAINIAHNPGANVAALYGSPTPTTPFSPTLSSQPVDFTLPLTMIPPTVGIYQPYSLAIDGYGNAWVAGGCANASSMAYMCLLELSSTGNVLSGNAGYALPVGTGEPYVAIDPSNNIWVGGQTSGPIKYSNSGSLLSPAAGYSECCGYPGFISIDGAGDVWMPYGGTNIGEISNTGTSISPTAGYNANTYDDAASVAIDGSGDAWAILYYSSTPTNESLVKLSPSGTILSGMSGYGGTALTGANTVPPIFDAAGNIWLTDQKTNGLVELSNAGIVLSGTSYTGGGVYTPISSAIDGAGDIWVGNQGPINQSQSLYNNPTLSEFSNAGVALSPTTGYGSSSTTACQYICVPLSIAVDGSGNVWVANSQWNYRASRVPVTVLIGAAVPVVTPIAGGLPTTLTSNGTSNLGTRP